MHFPPINVHFRKTKPLCGRELHPLHFDPVTFFGRTQKKRTFEGWRERGGGRGGKPLIRLFGEGRRGETLNTHSAQEKRERKNVCSLSSNTTAKNTTDSFMQKKQKV